MIEHAIVLAAGRGERLRPLSDTTPKPLLDVGGQPLMAWHLHALSRAAVRQVTVNTAWLEEQFEPVLGDGSGFGLRLHWSREGRDHGGALETGGGIAKALPMLGPVFWVVAGDVFLPDFRFDAWQAHRVLTGEHLAHLWMVPNAAHHPGGDFGLDDDGLLHLQTHVERLTWASVGLFSAEMFKGIEPGTRMALRPLLEAAIAQRRLGGSRLQGLWTDVGTLQRLQEVREWVARNSPSGMSKTDGGAPLQNSS